MLARAYASLHQWKEAQGELLRVVKVDRSNRLGFALLGEVLLRRNDYERAVPVLQHAQNLDPTSPQILSMLKRARAGQPLDAAAARSHSRSRRAARPTTASSRGRRASRRSRDPAAARRHRRPTPGRGCRAPPLAPTMASTGAAPARRLAIQPAPPLAPRRLRRRRRHRPRARRPPAADQRRGRAAARRLRRAKPQNAAAAALRQSAAVGETYLNDLLDRRPARCRRRARARFGLRSPPGSTLGALDAPRLHLPVRRARVRHRRRWHLVLVEREAEGEAVARLQNEAKRAIARR